jgi:hypothetical protein
MSGIESRFEQAWAHLERGISTGHARYVPRQSDPEWISRRRRRRGLLLKRLDFEAFQLLGATGAFPLQGFLRD